MAETIDLQIGEIRTSAFVARPSVSGPHAGIVLTHHRDGLDGFTARQVDAFAAAGFATIAPNHFHVMPPGVSLDERQRFLTDEQQAKDCAESARWLVAHSDVDADRIAVLGHCMGGRTTVVALAANPEIWRCGCDWYGGGVFRKAVGAWPEPGDPARLERIVAPLAGFFGNLDKHPSPADVDELDARLTKLGKPHVFHRYADTDHGYMNETGKRYHAASAQASMQLALAFLRANTAPR